MDSDEDMAGTAGMPKKQALRCYRFNGWAHRIENDRALSLMLISSAWAVSASGTMWVHVFSYAVSKH